MSFWDYKHYIGKNIGKYQVKDILGIGGMGVVYKAEHIYLNTEVAIKLLLPNESGEDWAKRFLREARVLAELKHPNIVEIYDFDFTEEGYPYYVMEMLEGLSLKDYLIENGTPDFDRFKDICVQIGEALFYAHTKGIIHRDLKPSNIFLTWEGSRLKVKIVDFGIAKLIAKSEGTMTLTKTTDFLGTPYYVAPEQVLNQDIGAHTDIYSFGLIVAEMLLGKPVRDEKSLGEILGVEIRKPVDLSNIKEIPVSVARAIFIATMPEPAERFKDVKAFVNAMFNANHSGIDSFSFDDRTRTLKHSFYLERERQTQKISQKNYSKKFFGIIIAIFLLIFSLIIFKNIHIINKKPQKKTRLVLLEKHFEVPPDASFFLGSTEESLFLATVDSIYSIPFKGNGKLWLTDVVHKEDIVGFDMEGNIFFKSGDSIYEEFLPMKRKRLFLQKAPQMDVLKVCYSGRFIAGIKNNVLKLFRVKNKKTIEVFSKKLSFTPSNLVLNNHYIFVYTYNRFAGFLIKNGKKILEKELTEIIGTPVAAIQKHGDYVAYGGWSDSVFLVNLKNKSIKHLVFSGKTTSLLFIPDTKSLLIIKENRIGIYRGGKIFELPIQDSLLRNVEVVPGGFSLLDVLNHRVLFVSYSDVKPLKVVSLSPLDLWSMASYKDKVFAGARDGKLFEIDTTSFKAKEVFKHNEGLTSILVLNKFLITASDDRTIGVFSLPDVSLKMRTKAHTYLINYLFHHNGENAFWSSSSDGTIRKWVLPDLTQEDVIKSEKGHHFAAFNIVNDLLIAGTWDKVLIVYEKQSEAWKLKKEYPLNSVGVYTMCYLKQLNLIVASGIEPSYLYLLDINTLNLYSIPEGNYNSWLIKSGENECMVFANGVINRFVFEKRGKAVFYTKYSIIDTNTSIITAGTITDRFIVAGNTKGQVFFFDKNKLPFQLEEKSQAERIF